MYQAYLCSKKARKRYASRELVDTTGRETADEGKGYSDQAFTDRLHFTQYHDPSSGSGHKVY